MEEMSHIRLLFVAGLLGLSALIVLLARAVAWLGGVYSSKTPRVRRPARTRPAVKNVAAGRAQ